jgi:hypothetical protein
LREHTQVLTTRSSAAPRAAGSGEPGR